MHTRSETLLHVDSLLPISSQWGSSRLTPEVGVTQYYLYDDFSDARAAGSLNGSLPQVGEAWVVTDTNSKISTSGGLLVFATGAAANDGAWGASRTRQAGRLLKVTVTPADTNGVLNVGWDNGQSGAVLDALQFAAAGVLKVIANGGTAFNVGVYTATSYIVVVQMRATGICWYIFGGAFAQFTKLIDTALGTAAGYPAVTVGSATTIATADDARVPITPNQGAPLASDSFNRGDGAPGNTDGLGAPEAGGAGLAWTGAGAAISGNAMAITPTQGADVVVNGGFATDANWIKAASWTISSGTANKAVSGSTDAIYQNAVAIGTWYSVVFDVLNYVAGSAFIKNGSNASPAKAANGTYTQTLRGTATDLSLYSTTAGNLSADNISCKPLTLATLFSSLVLSTVNVIWDCVVSALTAGTQAGFVARLDSASTPANFLIGYFDGAGNVKLDECVAGAYANLLSTAKAFAAGDTLRPDLSGSAWRLYHVTAAGVITLLGSGTTNVTTGNLFGCFSTYSANKVDSICALAKGNEGQYAALSGM